MLQIGDEVSVYSFFFVVILLWTRSPVWTTAFFVSFYFFLVIFRFPQVPASRAQQVLHPAARVVGPSRVSVVAHRGGSHDAPENTIAAIQEAAKNEATGVELDLEFSSDGIPILMHDDTVDRTTDGSGLLSQMTFAELRKLDAAAKHRLKDKYAGEKIPTLEEAVKECIKLNLTIYFDVKGHANEAAAALTEMYKKYPQLYDTSIVCSFEPKVIYKMRQSDPEVVTALTHRPWSLSCFGDDTPRYCSPWEYHWMSLMDVLLDWAHHHILWNLCGISAFLIEKDTVSKDYIEYWAERNVEVVVWTINTETEKAFYGELLNINYITDSLIEDCEPHF